jgi:hypothetical protein
VPRYRASRQVIYAMDAKIATEEGTFTAENAESAENICAIGIRAHNKKIQWLFSAHALQYRRDWRN